MESQLRYTTTYFGVGRISTDVIGVPVAQFFGECQPQRRAIVSEDSSWATPKIFKPKNYVPHRNTEVPDDISVLANPIMVKFPMAMEYSLMIHAILKYKDIRVGNYVSCPNYNLLGICSNTKCSYRHTKKTQPTRRSRP